MLLTNIKRIIKAGLINFWRNGWVSLATILIMVITLSVIGSLFFGKAILLTVLDQLQEKVDITVYFKTDTQENEISLLHDSLEKLDEVKSIEFVSREQALEEFQARHAENNLIVQSLAELDENPLGACLNIRAKNPSQYESIARFLEAGVFSSIDKINYRENEVVIDRLANILQVSKKLGTAISLVLVFIALLVTFNTIRLAIYSNREEIGVMRLVGASNKYIRSPYMIEGLLYGIVASLLSMGIFYFLTLWLGPLSERFFGGLNVFEYYVANFFQIFAILLAVGMLLGAASSWIATRRYLRA